MDYTTLTTRECFELACTEFGHENQHTLCIAQLLDLARNGHLDPLSAQRMAQIIYHHGTESLYYNEEWDEEEEPEWEEPDWGDEGFDPYMGCYTGDC
jgi:hypothetical protein